MAVNNTFKGFSAGTWGFSVNTWAFPWLSLEQTNKIKEQSKLMSTNPYDQMLIQDDMYKQELTKQKHENFVQERQAGRMELEQRTQNATDPKVKATNSSVKSMAALADMYRQYGYEHGKNWDDMQDEELVSRFNTKNPQVKKLADNFLTGGDDSEYRLAQQLGLSQDGYLKWKWALAKEQLDDAFWSNVWTKMKVWYNQSLDTLEKSVYRTSRDVENAYNEMWKYLANNVSLKKRMEKKLGREVSDEEYQQLVQRSLDQYDQNIARNKQEVLDQMGIVNYEAKKYADKNKLNEDIEAYYNNKSMTKSLLEGDFKWFFYKSAGDMAQNWEMLPIIWVTAMNPTAWKILMGTDSYLKESQEAFENMLNNWATFEEAEKWAVVVWLVNAWVEVGLESLLWWVDTRSADAIRKTFMKNIQQEAVNRWFWRTVMQAWWEYFKASGEEWLEEVVQQIVQNAAAKTVNENQKLFEWIWLAFEWGAYNPLNLLAWGNINRNYSNNVNLWNNVNTETNTETNTTEANTENQGILDKVTDYWAELITNTVSAQDKLYKAQEPRMNTLTSKKNLENRRANSDRANQLIVENGYLPTNTSERVEAHQATLNKLWNQVKSKINEWKWIPVDQSSIIEVLENYINEKKNLNVAAIEWDIAALEKELESLKKSQEEWTADLPVLENKKQVYNDIANWKEHEASKVYNDWIKLITAEIWKIEDQLLSEIPWEFSNLKKDVWALIDSYEDVFKADMKNQRSKGVWLTEAYSRIEWIWDMIEWALWIFKWEWGKVIQWAWKVLLWKSLAKAKDSDFLIEQGFKGLAEELNKNKSNVGLDKSQASSKTAKYQVADDLESQYETAVKNGDEARAKEILKEYAESKWYKGTEDYKGRWAWAAPSASVEKADFRNLEKIWEALEDWWESNLYGVANWYSAMPTDMLERENTWRYFRTNTEREAYYSIREAMDEIQRQMKEYWEVRDMPKVTVYRAVPDYSKSIKKLQNDIDKFIIWDDWKPHVNGSLSQLSKDALESYDYYADMYKKYGGTTPEENLYERLTNDRDYKDSLSVKEWMLESWWEWVTPSKQYARDHGNNRFDGEYRIIKDEIPADQLWWDWNAIEEWGFDDGNDYAVKKWAKNSRKDLEITYDDKGNLIPLSKRFNDAKRDTRYQKYWMADANAQNISANEWLNIKNFMNWRTVAEIAEQYGIDTKIVDKILTPEWEKALGMYDKWLITLAKTIKESTAPHELLHATFDMVDKTKKVSILEWLEKKLNVDEVQAEEWLADKFSEYYRTGNFSTTNMAKTFIEKIKQFFYKVKSYIDGTYANEKEIQKLFDDIINWNDLGWQMGSNTNNVDAWYQRTEGNLNDLKKEYYYVISPNYEITSWDDANVHWALDYMLEKKGIENTGKGILSKFRALNSELPKIKNWDDITNLSPIDQFWYDLKDKIIETYIKKKNIVVKDRDNWNKWEWVYPNHTYVLMEIWNYTAKPHISEFLYTKLKDEWYIK